MLRFVFAFTSNRLAYPYCPVIGWLRFFVLSKCNTVAAPRDKG